MNNGWIFKQPIHNSKITIAMHNFSLVNSKLKEFTKELNSYADLKEGWDYYKGKTFSKQFLSKIEETVTKSVNAFNRAESYYFELTPCPLGDGRVDVEIEVLFKKIIFTFDPDNNTVEVEIISNVLGQTQCSWDDESITNIVHSIIKKD